MRPAAIVPHLAVWLMDDAALGGDDVLLTVLQQGKANINTLEREHSCVECVDRGSTLVRACSLGCVALDITNAVGQTGTHSHPNVDVATP